jgi:hypothetical protein
MRQNDGNILRFFTPSIERLTALRRSEVRSQKCVLIGALIVINIRELGLKTSDDLDYVHWQFPSC